MSKIIKVSDTSNFWKAYDNEFWWFELHWNDENAKEQLSRNQAEFIYKYALITLKYGILMPNFKDFDNLHERIAKMLSSCETVFPKEWIPLNINRLYIEGGERLCSSILYIQKDYKIIADRIVNIELLRNYQEVFKRSAFYGYPVDFCFSINYIYLTVTNDVFFSKLWNSKTHIDERTNGYYVDNSELVYLNATRLNSFLRDFKILCFEYGATSYVSEIYDGYYKNFFCEDGVLIDKEIILYEDIYDMLPENLKYKDFENIKVELDDTNYRKYLNEVPSVSPGDRKGQ